MISNVFALVWKSLVDALNLFDFCITRYLELGLNLLEPVTTRGVHGASGGTVVIVDQLRGK